MDYPHNATADDMFHIPLTMRGMVKTQRYSVPGYPCLYLGESIYGCWEEMNRPPIHRCAVSRLERSRETELHIIDLRVPTTAFLHSPLFQALVPIIIACMIPVANRHDTYKPEYIVPQLIMQWVLKNRVTKNIHGICYTSTHINDDFNFPADTFTNYAFPVYSSDTRQRFCRRLCSIFRITDPTTNDIEKLKCPYPIDCGSVDNDPHRQRRENYRTSDFGNLERRLSDTAKFPLHTLNHRNNK